MGVLMPSAHAEIPATKTDTASAVTVADAAKRLAVSESHFWKMIQAGEVRAVKFGRRRVIPMSEILRILNGGAP